MQVERFGIAAFRSRQQLLRFDAALRRAGLDTEIVSTPSGITLSCGLSIKFNIEDIEAAVSEYATNNMTALIGFFTAEKDGQKIKLTRMLDEI